jgi:hypothetical protein
MSNDTWTILVSIGSLVDENDAILSLLCNMSNNYKRFYQPQKKTWMGLTLQFLIMNLSSIIYLDEGCWIWKSQFKGCLHKERNLCHSKKIKSITEPYQNEKT